MGEHRRKELNGPENCFDDQEEVRGEVQDTPPKQTEVEFRAIYLYKYNKHKKFDPAQRIVLI